jgi:DNA-binding NarL/FixJ family response regulator
MIRLHLRTALENRDEWVVVGEAENGYKALEKAREKSPQVILMDFVMPEMNGLEASRQLNNRQAKAPILMMTIDPSSQLEQEARAAGARGLCTKADLHCLIEAVEALIKGKTYFHWAPGEA